MKFYSFISTKPHFFLVLLLFVMVSCGRSGGGDGGGSSNNTTPSNLVINSAVAGTSTSFPNGDGSGVVNFTVTANNATSYKILIGQDTQTSTTGSFTYTFTTPGVNTFTVYASAYNGSNFVSTQTSVTVYVASKLIWSDEFSTDGSPNASNWNFETGNNNGWGNNELEYYTSRTQNAVVSNGTLKINLIKESYSGFNYTSARMTSQNKFSCKYGRIDIRAKLPSGAGTWPALWMLGDNIGSVGWPTCGEIDIMEAIGNNPNVIYGTLHYPGHYGGSADSSNTAISNISTEFHVYSLEWRADTIKFMVDSQVFKTFANTSSTPFNANFFLIMNVAMGGNFGGAVDPNFSSSTMEVDYVRVYQ